jgi:hypothetical protein
MYEAKISKNQMQNRIQSNLIFSVRFIPVAALAGGIRFARDISISLCNLLCRPCPHNA